MKVFGVTGWKNSGKTTLVAGLVEYLSKQGLRVSTVKHVHCDFDIDREGTDSYRHRQAGARQVMLAGSRRWALMRELDGEAEAELYELLAHLDAVDLVIVEGFKMGSQPKLQVVRPEHNTEPLGPEAQPLVAIASDQAVNPADFSCDGPVLPLNDVAAIARFILDYCDIVVPADA